MNNRSFFVSQLFLLVLPFVLGAQIPNAGFEQWTAGEPDGWITSNAQGVAVPVTQSTMSHSGLFALRGQVMTTFFPPIIQAGPQGAGFAVSQRHGVVTGFYQFSPVGGDRLSVNVMMFRNAHSIGAGAIAIAEAATSYAPFTVSVNYISDEVPDACIIKMSIISPVTGGDAHQGSTMLVDDLSFSQVVSVGENKSVQSSIPEQFILEQNYPNPLRASAFNPSTTIGFSLPHAARVMLTVYNQRGQEVARLVDWQLSAGHYETTWRSVGLASGVYFYRMHANEFVETKKLILLK